MKNVLFFFFFIAFFLFAKGQQNLQAQVSILFPAQTDGEHCGVVDIPVSIIGSTTLVGIQFTVNWHPADLEFIGIGKSDFPDVDGNSFGTRRTDEGLLTFLWYDPYLNGVDIATQKTFFTLRFKVLSEPQSTTFLRISNEPTPIVGYDVNGKINNISSNTAIVNALEETEY